MEIKNLKEWGWTILIIIVCCAATLYILAENFEPRKCTKWEFTDENGINQTATIVDIKILNLIIDEYNKTHKASTNPIEVLSHIMATFGKYPINQKSVSVVLDSIKN